MRRTGNTCHSSAEYSEPEPFVAICPETFSLYSCNTLPIYLLTAPNMGAIAENIITHYFYIVSFGRKLSIDQ